MLRRRWKAPRLATEASVSVDWVRALRRGYRNTGKGTYEPVVPDAAMLATLANVLGVTGQELRDIGRADASDALEILYDRPTGPTSEANRDRSVTARLERIRDDLDALLGELRA